MDALVSILIPAYNAERWIKETVESALKQTWPRKEIIVIDDGSFDKTYQIAKIYVSNMVKVITQQNMGGPAARNKALSLAQGDFIQWLDHDDLLAPNKLSEQMRHSEASGDDRVLYSSAFGRFYYRIHKAKFYPDGLWRDLLPVEYLVEKFSNNSWLQPGAWLVSRRLTEMAGPWLEIRSPDDDGEYYCRIVAASKQIKFVPEAKAYWRIGNYGSMSQSRSDQALEALFVTNERCIAHLLALEDSERTRTACVKFLQDRLLWFLPEKPELVDRTAELAVKLGGELSPIQLGMRYRLIGKIIGLKPALVAKRQLPKAKVQMVRNLDRLMYKLFR